MEENEKPDESLMEMPVWKMFNLAILMRLNDEETLFYDVSFHDKSFKIELNVSEIEHEKKTLH